MGGGGDGGMSGGVGGGAGRFGFCEVDVACGIVEERQWNQIVYIKFPVSVMWSHGDQFLASPPLLQSQVTDDRVYKFFSCGIERGREMKKTGSTLFSSTRYHLKL